METTDLVSIIIPCYNHDKYIIETLDSVKNSTYTNYEICIIDDGSKDNSTKIIQEWIHSNDEIKTNFISRENKGLTKTLNQLVNILKGKYIVVLGSDDNLTKESIACRVEYLKNNPNKKAVFGDAIIIDGDSNIISHSAIFDYKMTNKDNLLDDNMIAEELILNWTLPGPILMFEKNVIDEIGDFNEKLIVEDWDFYLRLLSINTLGFIDKIVAEYRLHGANTVSNKSLSSKIKIDRLKTIFYNFHRFTFKHKILFLKLLISKVYN